MGVNDVCVTNDPFIQLLPPSCRKVSEKANPLGLVSKLLPPGLISKSARYVGRSFWIWLCTVDDLTEKLVGKEWSDTGMSQICRSTVPTDIRLETDLLRAFGPDYNNNAAYHNFDSDSVKVSLALRKVIETTCIGSKSQKLWRNSFNNAICEILIGFREERPLIESECISMRQWMRLRVITISSEHLSVFLL